MSKNFTVIDEEFVCENCGKKVTKLGYTARDHCPYCLYSKHLDINPGDRECTCHGLMKPIGIEKYKNSNLKELSRFASGLEKDLSAVENAVASPLSNGFVDGTNSKLKMIKRTMYGRCGKELLAAKLILSNG